MSFEQIYVLDNYLGLTDGIVTEASCYSLYTLLDWDGQHLERRIYAVSPLETRFVEVYLRNMRSDYCDLGRKQAETDALINTAGTVSRIEARLLPDMDLLKVIKDPNLGITRKSWREGLTRGDQWFQFLGLTKQSQPETIR